MLGEEVSGGFASGATTDPRWEPLDCCGSGQAPGVRGFHQHELMELGNRILGLCSLTGEPTHWKDLDAGKD